jgi:hypothetical protein
MANRWPVSCIFASKEGLSLPYDRAVAKQRSALVVDVIASITNQAACAMVECALFSVSSTTPPAAIAHLEPSLVAAVPNLSLDKLHNGAMSSLALIQTARPHLEL